MKRRAQPAPAPSKGGGWNIQYNALFRAWHLGRGLTKEEVPSTVGFRTIVPCKRPLCDG
jgi:hypothetical protein